MTETTGPADGRDRWMIALIAGVVGVIAGAAITLAVVTATGGDDSASTQSDRLLAAVAVTMSQGALDSEGLVVGGLGSDPAPVLEAMSAGLDDVLGSMHSPSTPGIDRSDFAWFDPSGSPDEAIEQASSIARELGWVEPLSPVRIPMAGGGRGLALCSPPDDVPAILLLSASTNDWGTTVAANLVEGGPLGTNPCAPTRATS